MDDESKINTMLDEKGKRNILQAPPHSEYEEQQMLQEPEDNTTNKTFINVKDNIKRIKDDGAGALGTIENTYRTVFENYAVAITLVDEQERIISWNKYTEELLGMSENDLYLVPVSTLYPPEEWQRMRKENIRQKGIKYRMETKIIRKDNRIFNVEISVCVLKSEKGKIVGSVGIIKDITKQKEMERALEKSEKKFKQLYEKAPVPYHTLSSSGVITDVNEIWCQILGYSKEEVVGRSIFDFINEAEREIAKASFEKKLQSKTTYSQANERAYVSKTGEKRFFVIRDFFSFDENNNVTAVYTIMDDVTELKKAEYELQKNEIIRESARRLQIVIDTVNDGITLSDKQGHFEIFNAKMEKITGYSKHEADVCDDFLTLIYPDQNERKKALENISETLNKGESKNFETTIQTKTGVKKTLWVSSSITNIDGQDMFLSVYHDITERKRAEDALRESEKKFRDIAELLPEVVFECDIQGNLTFVNKAAFGKFGYTQEEFDRGVVVYQFIAPVDRKKVDENIGKIIRGIEKGPFEYIALRKDGTEFPVTTYSSVIIHDGRPVGLRGILVDITEQKEAERKIRFLKEYNENILESNPNPMIVVKGKQIEYVNKSFVSIFGETKNEYITRNLKDVIPSESLPVFEDLLQEGDISKELKFRGKDFIIHSFVIKKAEEEEEEEEEEERVGIIFQDITEIKKVEIALKKSEERHRLLYESSRDAIMTLEPPTWAFTSGNPATVNMFRAKNEEDFISFGPGDLSPPYQPDGRPSAEKAKEMIEKAMQEGANFFEWTHKRIDGEEFPATVLLTRMEIAGRQFLQATVRDITEQKQAEDELKRKIEELERYKKVTIGRELQMIELKKQIKELEERSRNK